MSGKTPDTVDVYKSKIFDWIYLTANYYKDIPDRMNVYIQDNEGVIHDDMILSVLELEQKIRDEHWIFFKKLTHQWFDAREGGMTVR
jgi:hypothetical protein